VTLGTLEPKFTLVFQVFLDSSPFFKAMTAFGKEIMKKEFVLDSKHTFLNHGSYGSVPRRVNEYRMR